ncbi:glycine cleavage system protein R [Acidocella aminolytica]|jgi:glycine cleavage system regulatory protein|uniref:Amino acid permease n=1 Tax=Acidocella aminolytica 101 = DSM 11237 TaxID=1120923 RepID=A0A0D6PFC7_9PROT|nr:ACT domain-containing protein [Acidocella aminolytica]GAN79908.1 amino acid permease [Acidocella aminolytica 101 = DSM 11237]GBQ41046.1 glycine cleavage system regulatory protein [Acidocella aminolytica 101 = DSM 11237]SHE59677.1 Glycine cleavage system regulatory protein [Acidocella aminolytica 101 = DSM 11237]
MASLVVSLAGPDRPGLVNTLSEKIIAGGGSWLESRLAHLAGTFAGIILVRVADEGADALATALSSLSDEGLAVNVLTGSDAPAPAEQVTLELLGNDRPGIVREVTQTLRGLGVNIEEFSSRIESAPFTGEDMFRAVARLGLPRGLSAHDVSHALEKLTAEFMVDIKQPEEA